MLLFSPRLIPLSKWVSLQASHSLISMLCQGLNKLMALAEEQIEADMEERLVIEWGNLK